MEERGLGPTGGSGPWGPGACPRESGVPLRVSARQAMATGARSGEDDRGVLVDNDPVLQVPADRAGEHGTFHMPPQPAQVIGRASVVHPDDVLLDDRPR